MNGQEIIERIMTQHWDLAACPCWICVNGREQGYRAREEYLRRRNPGAQSLGAVRVEVAS